MLELKKQGPRDNSAGPRCQGASKEREEFCNSMQTCVYLLMT